jgi:hypothetical protein
MDDLIDIDRALALLETFIRNGWSEEEISSLHDDLMLARMRSTLGLRKETVRAGDAPFVPDGWAIESHAFFFRGELDWRDVRTTLHYEPAQIEEGGIPGRDLQRKLERLPAMNATALDFLLEHPHRIPDGWKGALVHFWGTVYRDPSGFCCVRHLRWTGADWTWGRTWVGDDIGLLSPAAVLDESPPAPELELPPIPLDLPLIVAPVLDCGDEELIALLDRPFLEGSHRPTAPTVEELIARMDPPVEPSRSQDDEAIASFLARVAFEADDRVTAH